ncbi:hypothetical protein BU26DRAFT_514285 [Trematosphaeria pertusa]|uniref:Uncharacterized protein n=1 Tax=Trematosphaeria pertusa TaxID=390896 RepID=A0A6A6IWA8_9PLEO|nr:uncharacterized protein BU26DRAFT_514285 [Trematosphaeria pertusa]KAF2254357.1 hypothetical protein BU26DRAFT_514285 [Trematosphaeria pertusa]
MPSVNSGRRTLLRYFSHCVLSLLSVAAYRTISAHSALRVLYILLGLPLASAVIQVICICSNKKPSAHCYSMPLLALTVALGHIAGLIQQSAHASPRPHAQACAIRFALSFFLVSESELYRLYYAQLGRTARGAEVLSATTSTAGRILLSLDRANADSEFCERSDVFNYEVGVPAYLRGAGTFAVFRDWKSGVPKMLSLVLFYAVNGCFCYPVKALLNLGPGPPGADLFVVATGRDVLFTTDKTWLMFLGWFVLLRPARLLNVILFWAVVDVEGSGLAGTYERR